MSDITVLIWGGVIGVLYKYGIGGGRVYEQREIQLRRNALMIIPKFDASDEDARYAIRVSILEDLDDRWADDESSYLHFQIYATHSISGFGEVFEQKFFRKGAALKAGDYRPGASFEIE